MGRDILGSAQTGTGKTASFTLPMIDILASGRAKARMPRSLILAPTRELAAQVAESFEKFSANHKMSMALLIGGVSFSDQDAALSKGVDVLIATPGRLLDHFERGKVLLQDVKILVIDEADRMLSGFLGPRGYRRGVDLYFQRHDGKAVTCDDFLAALADANDLDLSLFSLWYSQAGTPDLTVRRQSASAGRMKLTLSQSLQQTAAATAIGPMPIPVKLGLVGETGEAIKFSIDGQKPSVEQTILLTTDTMDVELELTQLSVWPVVPSVLRGFSAPVRLHDDLTVDELAILATHDADGFNRYEAFQRLAHMALEQRLVSHGANVAIEAALIKAMAAIFEDTDLRYDYKSLCLSIPSQSEVEHRAAEADPVAIWQARQALQGEIGSHLSDHIMLVLATDDLCDTSSGRALRNRCLYLGVAAASEEAVRIAAEHSSDLNMTLSMGGLAALNTSSYLERSLCLADFYERWKNSPLVMEKWLGLEASAPFAGTTEHLLKLMRDPVFDPNNPNKLRSVLGAFAMANPVQFHKEDGSGYQFIAEQIAEMDSRNPQIAARLALVLTRFAHIEPGRRGLMQKSVIWLSERQLSDNLHEIIAKALAS